MTREQPRWPYYALAEAEWQNAAEPEQLPEMPGIYAIFCPGCKQKPAVTVVAGKNLKEAWEINSAVPWESAKLTSPFARLRFKTLEVDPDIPCLQTELERYRDKILRAFEEYHMELTEVDTNGGS